MMIRFTVVIIGGFNNAFHGLFLSFALQCNPAWMRGNFGLKQQNSPKLPRIHARFHYDAN